MKTLKVLWEDLKALVLELWAKLKSLFSGDSKKKGPKK